MQSLILKLWHYARASVGPVGSAGAQFILLLQLLHLLSPEVFGRFSFLMVVAQFSLGVWTALFCAPLPALIIKTTEAEQLGLKRTLFTAGLVGALGSFILFVPMSMALGLDLGLSLLFASFGALNLIRWFARAYAYATDAPVKTMQSDLIYCVVLILGVIYIQFVPISSLHMPLFVLTLSVAIGILPFGVTYLKAQFVDLSLKALKPYKVIWQQYSGWSLLGVITMEATANAHAYILTWLAGPSAFAPVAASALFIRPIGVAMNALTEFERPKIAQSLKQDGLDKTKQALTFFRWSLMAVWCGSGALAALILFVAPHLVFPKSYDLNFMIYGTVLWMLVAFMRQIRTPESVLLQAGGAFKPLALASVVSSVISIISVVLLFVTLGALWSIVGIVIGEAVFAIITRLQAGRYLNTIKS
jgi:O-antigen/teichoic acid export membrane protein